ncbi:hypothetical protein ZWY2020_035945 [Hordeum vulgare]|nr:hypothetical protein ZWY2020_035945 [Hordeum vulgare]
MDGVEEVLGVLEVPAMEEVLGVREVPVVEEVIGVLEVVQEQEVEGPVEDEGLRRRARVLQIYSNPISTCQVCIHPALCRKCGIRCEPSIFLCLGCRLPVPKDLPSCELCGNPLLCDNYWCKDCATTVAINKDGVCIRCRRNPSIYLDDEKEVQNVPDSQV